MSDATPPVAVVVLNWHRRADTLACLRALSAVSYPALSVVVVDNGCAELSPDEIGSLVRNGRYLHSATNLGFAGGANLGMRAALDTGAAYVWFLNNDATPQPTALDELIAVMERTPSVAIAGPKILQGDRPDRLDSVALSLDLRSGRIYLLGHDAVDRGQYDHLGAAAAVTGCAMLVRARTCVDLGGFDESYFAYLEDADLCLRARAVGGSVAVAPRARVLHRRAPATAGRQSTASLYYTTRNHLQLLRRHAPARGRRMRETLVAALNLAFALRAPARERRDRCLAVWRGIRDYRRGAFGAGNPPAPA